MKIMNIKLYNPHYRKNGVLEWKRIGAKTGKRGVRKKKNYPLIRIENIRISGDYTVDETVLQQSRELYDQTHEMIPVFLSFDNRLIAGFEQFELAKELGLTYIPTQRLTQLNKKEQKQFRESVINKKLGNKKYPVTAIDGSKIFLSLNQFKKTKQAISMARKCRYTLEILPDFTFRARHDNDYVFGGPEKGIRLNTLRKKLGQIIGNEVAHEQKI